MQDKIKQLEEENSKLREIIARHDLCHDLHGKVGAKEFAQGCAQEQRKLYGHAPDADQIIVFRSFLLKAAQLIDGLEGQQAMPDNLLDASIKNWKKHLKLYGIIV